MLNLSNEQFKVGMYIRLSREDGDKQESESIGNQRLIIKRYLQENDLTLIDEYVDDGVSGTTFDRKDFNRMIRDVESKKINMIVTKDLSRLGRDYIKTGYYLENYFPEKSVRYVAILDGIDTYLDSTNNDISPFKAIMNDMYAKDISKKIKSVLREKQKNGQFLGSIPPYGYKFNDNEKGKLEVDEYVAEIVRIIFNMYAEGHGSMEIQKYLNNKNIVNPSTYHKIKNRGSTKWNQITILAMLKNQAYIGNTVQNRRRKISYKSKKIIDNPKEQWITVENTHEPIVDKDVFDKVQLILSARDTTKYTKHDYLLKGMLKCHHCGRNLQIVMKSSGKKKVKNPYINCVGHEKRGKHPISINYWDFEETIVNVIKEICKMYLDETIFVEVYKKHKNGYFELLDGYQKKLNEIEDKIQKINSNVDQMYFDKLNDIITTEDYTRYSNQFSVEKKSLSEKAFEIKQKIKTIKKSEENTSNDEEIKKLVNEFLTMKKVDKLLVYRLINHIEIDKEKNIYIHFNFNHLNIISDNVSIKDGRIEFDI